MKASAEAWGSHWLVCNNPSCIFAHWSSLSTSAICPAWYKGMTCKLTFLASTLDSWGRDFYFSSYAIGRKQMHLLFKHWDGRHYQNETALNLVIFIMHIQWSSIMSFFLFAIYYVVDFSPHICLLPSWSISCIWCRVLPTQTRATINQLVSQMP